MVVRVVGCEVFRVDMDWFRVWYGGLSYGVCGV